MPITTLPTPLLTSNLFLFIFLSLYQLIILTFYPLLILPLLTFLSSYPPTTYLYIILSLYLLFSSITSVTKTVPGGTFFVSSFFIGLSFCSGLFAGNVAPPIQDFLSRVNIWDSKKNFMEICVKVGSGSACVCSFVIHL
jgi:hypothetical protein